jgi:hypothetical protein
VEDLFRYGLDCSPSTQDSQELLDGRRQHRCIVSPLMYLSTFQSCLHLPHLPLYSTILEPISIISVHPFLSFQEQALTSRRVSRQPDYNEAQAPLTGFLLPR